MSRQRLSQVHVLLIVSLTPLMFYARLAWTQEGPSASKTPTQVSILAAPFAEGPEGGVRFPPGLRKFVLAICAKPGTDPFTAEIPHT